MSETCSHCGRAHYRGNPEYLVSTDCWRGYDADTGNPVTLCLDCLPRYEFVRDGSGLNKFRLRQDG